MKVSELEGAELDYWVARAEGFAPKIEGQTCFLMSEAGGKIYVPSTNWSQGGPIIEKEKIGLEYDYDDAEDNSRPPWFAFIPDEERPIKGHRGAFIEKSRGFGPTPLIAAMRARVAAAFGEEVDD